MQGYDSESNCSPEMLIESLVAQADRVCEMLHVSVESLYSADGEAFGRVEGLDDAVDAEDVRIEREAVRWVTGAFDSGRVLDDSTVRLLFTAVKVNNELERIGDLAVSIASRAGAFDDEGDRLPEQIRVVGNSVVGIIHEAASAFGSLDATRAERVLKSDDITEACREAVLSESETAIARGTRTPEFAFALNRVAAALSMAGDHATNIAEQVIYVATGKIVRHKIDRWGEPRLPE